MSIYKPWGAIKNRHPFVSLWQRCMHDLTPILRGLRTNSHSNEDKYHHRSRLQPFSGNILGINSWILSVRLATKRLRELHQRKSRRITNFWMKTLILVLHHPQLPSGLLCRLLGWPAGSTQQAMSTSRTVVTRISSRCLINTLRRVAPPRQHMRSADFIRSPRTQERQRRHRRTPSRSVNSVAPPR